MDRSRREGEINSLQTALLIGHEIAHVGAVLQVLLVKSGATLSMVTSRFPRITGSFAIFSGLGKVKQTPVQSLLSSTKTQSEQRQMVCTHRFTDGRRNCLFSGQDFQSTTYRSIISMFQNIWKVIETVYYHRALVKKALLTF